MTGIITSQTIRSGVYFTAAFIRNINPDLVGSEALIWAAMNVLPLIVGITMLAGIAAAGISSASTFLSLIGFSAASDILPNENRGDKRTLRISRLSMLGASLVILALVIINPPKIFVIMYFGGTVIASSWSVAAIGSVWSRRLSRGGAYLSMLLGFLGCVGSKMLYAGMGLTPPVYLDSFFIGIALSLLGAVIGSAVVKISPEEAAQRAALRENAPETDIAKARADNRMWLVYLVFAVLVGLFFLFMYALPYTKAAGI